MSTELDGSYGSSDRSTSSGVSSANISTNPLQRGTNKTKVSLTKISNTVVGVTEKEYVKGCFGELVGCERPTFAVVVVGLIIIVCYHLGLGVRNLAVDSNLQYQTETHAYSDASIFVDKEIYFAGSMCASSSGDIDNAICYTFLAASNERVDIATFCRMVTPEHISIFSNDGKASYPCCTCIFSKKTYDGAAVSFFTETSGASQQFGTFVSGHLYMFDVDSLTTREGDSSFVSEAYEKLILPDLKTAGKSSLPI